MNAHTHAPSPLSLTHTHTPSTLSLSHTHTHTPLSLSFSHTHTTPPSRTYLAARKSSYRQASLELIIDQNQILNDIERSRGGTASVRGRYLETL